MQEYTFTDGSTHDYHEFNHKRFGNCLHVDTANCDMNKQYICHSLQYIGKNYITYILFCYVTFTELTNNGYRCKGGSMWSITATTSLKFLSNAGYGTSLVELRLSQLHMHC